MRRAALASAAALLALGGIALATPGAFGGFSAKIANSTDTVGTATWFQCSSALGADSGTALFQWPLSDAAGSTAAADVSGAGHAGVYQGTTTTDATAPMACPRDPGTSWSLDGTTQSAYYDTAQVNPQVFTIEIWFRTTVAGGKLIGFGGTKTGGSSQYDRHLYINSKGQVVFGIYSGTAHTVTSTAGYTDGAWHSAAATLSSAGMVLYVDGAQVAADPASTTPENFTGYWRVGYDTIGGAWPSAPTSGYFKGRLRYAAVYTSALTAAQIKAHDAAGR